MQAYSVTIKLFLFVFSVHNKINCGTWTKASFTENWIVWISDSKPLSDTENRIHERRSSLQQKWRKILVELK